MDKIIFLDIDGVLNNLDSVIPKNGTVIEDFLISKLEEFKDCKIVLTSTWASNFNQKDDVGKYIEDIFAKHGLKIDGTIKITKPNILRGKMIKTYLQSVDDIRYAIVDDYHFDYTKENLSKNFVYVDREFGIQDDDVSKMKMLLKEDLPF